MRRNSIGLEGCVDSLKANGFIILSDPENVNSSFSVIVHQAGTELVIPKVEGYNYPLLETRPIVVSGTIGRIGLKFVVGQNYNHANVARLFKDRNVLRIDDPASKTEPKPTVASTPHSGTYIRYPSALGELNSYYMDDYVQIEAGIRIMNPDIELLVRDAVKVAGVNFVGAEIEGFSNVLLNVGRHFARFAESGLS